MVNLSLGSTRTWRASSTTKPSFASRPLILSILLVNKSVPFYPFFPDPVIWSSATNRPWARDIKGSWMSPRRCIPPDTHSTVDLPCTPHTTPTAPATHPFATFSSHSCPHPPTLTVTQHGPALTLAKDQIATDPVSTIAHHSVVTADTVDPTLQTALSAAAATELVYFCYETVRNSHYSSA